MYVVEPVTPLGGLPGIEDRLIENGPAAFAGVLPFPLNCDTPKRTATAPMAATNPNKRFILAVTSYHKGNNY